MRDIGRELQQARESKDLSLENISSRTLISKKYLLALEKGDYKVFPGVVYLKGALRKYAAEVGINPEEAIAWYEGTIHTEDVGEEAEARPVRQKSTGTIQKTRRINKRRLLVYVVLIIFSLAALSAIYNVIVQQRDHASPPPQSNDGSPPGVVEPEIEEPVPEPEEPALPVFRVERDGRQDQIRFNVYGTERMLAEITFTERCWVSVSADGQQVVEQNFSQGETVQIEAGTGIVIRIGNPPGMKLVINGESVEVPASSSAYTLEIVAVEPE